MKIIKFLLACLFLSGTFAIAQNKTSAAKTRKVEFYKKYNYPKEVFETEATYPPPNPAHADTQWHYKPAKMIPANMGEVYNLRIADSKPSNPQLRLAGYHHTANWNSSTQKFTWNLAPHWRTTTFTVEAVYISVGNEVGNTIKVNLAGKTISAKVEDTKGEKRTVSLGKVEIRKGQDLQLILSGNKIDSSPQITKLFGLIVKPLATPHRYFDSNTKRWSRQIPQEFIGLQFRTTPSIMEDKSRRKGLAIIITEDLKKRLKKLGQYVAHKKKIGFNVMVVTDKQFGGGVGPDAAVNIRKWLGQNYKKRQIDYALLIGNPNPVKGRIPMYIPVDDHNLARKALNEGYRTEEGHEYHPSKPSDYPYVDCSGPGWGHGVHNAPDQADGKIDVYVGRISYYGEDSKHAKAKDVDAILQKIINFETAIPEQVMKRYYFENDIIPANFYEHAGIPFVTRKKVGWTPIDHDHWFNNIFLDKYPVSVIRSGGHASPVWIQSNVSSTYFATKEKEPDYMHNYHVFGGCDCCQPEHPENMGYMSLRYTSIGNVGASRSIAGYGARGQEVAPFQETHDRHLLICNGLSLGEAAWRPHTSNRTYPDGGALLWNFLGDPSVVMFPRSIYPKRDSIVRPVHRLRESQALVATKSSAKLKQEYDIQNVSRKTLPWSVSSNKNWFTFNATKGMIKSGEAVTITGSLSKKSLLLEPGVHKATITFRCGKEIHIREYEYEVYEPKLLQYEKMIQVESDLVNQEVTQGRTISFELAPMVKNAKYTVFDDFENGLYKWEDAQVIGEGTASGYPKIQQHKGSNWLGKPPQQSGKRKSKEFTIKQKYISFELDGGATPGEWERKKKFYYKFTFHFGLFVDGKMVRASNLFFFNEERTPAILWDVTEFIGKKAYFELASNMPWRPFYIDNIRMSNSPYCVTRKAKWAKPLIISDFFTIRINEDNFLEMQLKDQPLQVSKKPLNLSKKNKIMFTINYRTMLAELYLNGRRCLKVGTASQIYPVSWCKAFRNLPMEVNKIRFHNYPFDAKQAQTDFTHGISSVNPSPASGSISDLTTPTLEWVELEPNRTLGYEVQIDSNKEKLLTGKAAIIAKKIKEPKFKPAKSLLSNRNYYWRVITYTKDRKRVVGDVWKFKTNYGQELITNSDFEKTDKWIQLPGMKTAPIKNGKAELLQVNSYQLAQKLDIKKYYGDEFEVSANFSSPHAHIMADYRLVVKKSVGGLEVLASESFRHFHGSNMAPLKLRLRMKRKPKTGETLYFAVYKPSGHWTAERYPILLDNVSVTGPMRSSKPQNKAPRFQKEHFNLPSAKPKDSTYEFLFAKYVKDEDPSTLKFEMVKGPDWLTVHSTGRVFAPFGAPTSTIGQNVRFTVKVKDKQGLEHEATASFKVISR